MRPAGITVALFAYWYAGVVGAASLPPDDQYSPQPSAYRRDVSQGPRGYPNWLQYPQDPSTKFDPTENKPAVTVTPRSSGTSRETGDREDSPILDSKLSDFPPARWNHETADSGEKLPDIKDFHLDVPEDADISAESREDIFVADDTFQDQGPGSVEVYKLDLLRESSLLLPEAKRKQLQQQLETSRMKSKNPKKATIDEILWKLKPIEPSKVSLPSIFRQPPRLPTIDKLPRINENRKDDVFGVGGVPELQVGCEGLEAPERKRRSNSPIDEASDELELPLVIVDLDDEPRSGEAYEEMDELLKLKNLETSSPTPKPRRRADIDPALFNDRRYDDVATFPERGDLGTARKRGLKVKRSTNPEKTEDSEAKSARYRREEGPSDDDATGSRPGGRKLLWVDHPERDDDHARNRHYQTINENRNEPDDLWGFGEDDGAISGSDDNDNVLERLRNVEMEKRRRENERRRHEEMERRRADQARRSHSQGGRPSESSAEIERIRQNYERQLEKEQRERQRIENERRDQARRRHWEEDRRRTEEANRRREEESRRRNEEEARRRQGPPSALTRPEESNRVENRSRNQHEREEEERKLRDYVNRNRPYDPRSHENRRRPDEQPRTRHDDERRRHMEEERRRYEEERRRQTEEERRRQQIEEHRRRQQRPDEEERKRQLEEHRRRQQRPDEEERKRQMDEARRRRLEEERKLQDYVRRNQPVNAPRRNNSEIFIPRESDLEEQRRILEAARQYERNRMFPSRTNEPRSHGPSAPTNSGHRQSSIDYDEMRRRQEAERERRRLEEEERRREEEYRRAESRRRDEERRRLEAIQRQEENRRSQSEPRRSSWQDSESSRRPTNTQHRGSVEAEVRDREAEELRRQGAAARASSNSTRNHESEWKRRMEERERERAEREERERIRIANERNSRNNGRRRPQHGDTGFRDNRHRGESARSLEERRRREHARLNSLPVSARIIVRSNDRSRPVGRHDHATTEPTPPFDPRGNFDNDIDFPAITPNRPGLDAGRFPVPATRRPPVQSPGACVWAIVQCCPGRNRLTSCFESMGCPGANWDPNPCKSSLAEAARAEVMKFYEAAAEDERTRF